MYSTYIAPTERPITSREIKRALLTYDKVLIASPTDRDYFPSQSFMMALGMPPIFGFPMGNIRPLGKVNNYDNSFDQMADEIKISRLGDYVSIVSTYQQPAQPQFTLGSVDMGGFPLNVQFMLSSYRSLASDNTALQAAVKGDEFISSLNDDQLIGLAIADCRADGSINDSPALPPLEGALNRGHLRSEITNIARARVATIIKSLGYCAQRELIPTFSSSPYQNVGRHIIKRAADVLDYVSEYDTQWILRNRVLKLIHDEYIDDEILDQMNVEDVIRFRTVAWGEQASARDALLQSAALLAREQHSAGEFDSIISQRINDYRKLCSQIETDRKDIKFKINCDLANRPLQAIGSAGVAEIAGRVAQLQHGIGVGALLIAGTILSIDLLKQHREHAIHIRNAEEEILGNICFGFHSFYEGLAAATGSEIEHPII